MDAAPDDFADLMAQHEAECQALRRQLEQLVSEIMAFDIPFHLDDDLKPLANSGSESKMQIALLVQLGRDVRELADALGKPVSAVNASATTPVVLTQPEPRAQ